MMLPLVLLTLAAAPTRASVDATVRDRFEAVGRSAPEFDPALTRAATELAARALSDGVEDAAGLLRVTSALSRQAAWEPNPVVIAVRAGNDALVKELAKQDLGTEPSSHLGVGLAVGAERSAVVVLLAKRRVELSRFTRHHAKPAFAQRLCVKPVDDTYSSVELFITRPSGTVERAGMPKEKAGFCADVDLPVAGRHAVEALATGPRGPEVVALFFVDVGEVQADADDATPEPKTPQAARAALLVRINALRLQYGALALQPDEALQAVAQAWADRLAREGFFSHVAPDGSTLRDRLTESGYRFATAGENLGLSSGPLAAHFGIEHSPGHRSNLLDPRHHRAGFGLATRPDGLTVLVELFANPLEEEKDPLGALYASLADERAKRKLPALQRNAALEKLAQQHARAALAQQLPKAALPGQPSLHDRAFELVESLSSVSVDVLVSETPRLAPESKNLAAAANRSVGVGVVRGDSAKFGRDRYWIVVIYGVPGE